MVKEVRGIFVSKEKGASMEEVSRAQVEEGKGIVNDRYCSGLGLFNKPYRCARHITLIEEETFEALKRDYKIDLEPRLARRNILTRNIALNHFVGKKLRIGNVVVLGEELCEPCGYLSKMLDLPLKEALKHRGGLRCKVLAGGEIFVGQEITCD